MSNLEHLLSLLGSQREVLSRLLELVREERECLVHNRTERLEVVIEDEVQLLAIQREVSTRIVRELTRLCLAHGLEGQPSLGRLIDAVPAPDADRLRDCSTTLTTLTTELQREGRITWFMAQRAMNYIDFALKLIGRAQLGAVPYSPRAAQTPASLQVLINNCA